MKELDCEFQSERVKRHIIGLLPSKPQASLGGFPSHIELLTEISIWCMCNSSVFSQHEKMCTYWNKL